MKRILLVILAVLMVLIAAGCGGKSGTAEVKYMDVKAEDILNDYIRDIGVAESKYKGKNLQVSGQLINKGQFTNNTGFFALLASKHELGRNYDVFVAYPVEKNEEVNKFKMGDFVVAKGVCVGMVPQKDPKDISIQITFGKTSEDKVELAPVANSDMNPSSSKSATTGNVSAPPPAQKNPKKVALSAEEKRKLDVFFSNFAETWGENMPKFGFDGINNADLVRFGVAHNVINRKQVVKIINGKQAVPVGEVRFATMKYFGKDIQPQSAGNIECDGTYFYAVRADRNADCVARIKEFYDNQDGTYTAYYISTLPSTDGREYTATLAVSQTDSSRYVFKENR